MTENIVQTGSQYVSDVQGINKNLMEKTLRMRCLAYLSQVKSQLLVETIYDMNASRQELAKLSKSLRERTEEAERQRQIIEQQSRELEKQNKSLEIERQLLELKVEERDAKEKQAREILLRTQKMESLGKLTGGVAHDYNNILNIISGYAELLNVDLNTDPKLSKYVHAIQHASERGSKLTRKLLDISRKKTTEARKLNINELLREMQQLIEKTLTARIELKLELEENLWDVWLDSSDMEDALINMSINAMHAMEGPGRLTIGTSNQSLNALDAHVLQVDEGDFVVLRITDTGRGMDQATRDRIFEPFYTTKGENGTGLGLSQVYGFIDRSGGAIKVYSEIDKGSSFVIYFPRCLQEENEETEQQTEKNEASLYGEESILIVDDETALLDMCSEILRNKGYRIFCASNTEQAIELLAQEKIDLMLSDIVMPGKDGYQLADYVLEKYPHIKIQLVSGFSDNRHQNMTNSELHENIIYKPYNSHDLLSRIRSLLDQGVEKGKNR